jgi:hypothetical protein
MEREETQRNVQILNEEMNQLHRNGILFSLTYDVTYCTYLSSLLFEITSCITYAQMSLF